ncbi:hypothetical protein FRC12_013666, partial [Ceratobasidium sp. 428]
FDVASLVIFCAMFGGAIYAAMLLNKQFSGAVDSTKDSLKKRGLDISEHGLKVKTDKRMDHGDYIGATQKNLVGALKNASYGSPVNQKAVPESLGQGYDAPGTRHRANSGKK